ncbi:MAG: hypothetical protein IIB87_07030, partial [Chloroflexi bacterium]|nr:hypothetical protein [Chloroflexota bacterium]
MTDENKSPPEPANLIDIDKQVEEKRPAFRLGGKIYRLPKITIATMEEHGKLVPDAENVLSGNRVVIQRLALLLDVPEKELEDCDLRAIL